MIAADTNVVLRFLLGDHPHQTAMADACVAAGIFVSHGVLMEAEWVLRSAYELKPARIADLFTQLLEIDSVEIEDRDALIWAVGRYRAGADWGDLLHLIAGRACATFATFDRALAKEAGPDAPTAVQLLA